MTKSVSESSAAILSSSVTEGPMRVLHVDDDSSFLTIAKECLRMHGEFQVETARCIEEAKDKLGREKYDVIVCDYQIPGKDGLEFLKELRKEGNDIPFIIFTGKGREEVAIKALNMGADGYFNKNGEPKTVYGELAHGIRQALERKTAKAERWQREEKLRATLDSSPDPIIISDLDGSIIDCNEATLTLTGYPSKKEIVGKNSFEFIAEKDRERALKNLKKASEQEAVKNVEYTFLKKGKEEYQGELSVTALKDSSGNITGFVGTIRDITERKETERRLRESEEHYRLLFEQSPFGIKITHADGTVIDANSNMQTITGYSKDELKKINSFDMYEKPEQRKALLQAIKQHGGVVGFSARLKRKDGASVDALLNVSQVHIRGKNFLQTTLQDITEQKKAEEELRHFSAAIKESIDGIVISDLEGTVVDLNETALGFYGAINKSEVIGKSAFDLMPPEQKTKLSENMNEVMAKGRGRRRVFDVITKNGARISVDITTSLMRNADGSPAGLVAILRDVTERRKAEEEVRKAMEKLEVVNEKLQVVGGLTRHDVRNKLAAITGNAYLIGKKLPENGVVLDYVKQIEASVEQTVRILEFAKAYEMLGAEELAYIDVEKTVNEAASLFPDLRDVKVANDCHGLTVLADSLLRQLFYNLIDNSLKYGEKLSIIRIHYEDKNDHLNVIYQDDGVGISQAAKPKIFDEGYTTGKGSGYGLYLIKKMMEVYCWAIKETGEPGKGALFTMTIPKTNEKGRINYKLH
jgi:PAS domain S-box-containing protein